MNFSRRQLLRAGVGAGAMLAAGVWPGWARAADAPAGGDFTFLCVNDLHFYDERGVPFFEQMVRQMRATDPKPDFCLIVGDLAEDGLPKQFGEVKELLGTLNLPIHVVVGNHDYLGQTNRAPFDAAYPDSINYTFDHAGWQFVGLDTTQGRQFKDTLIQRPTFDWLDANLPKLDRRRPVVLFTHFPLGFLLPARPMNADALLAKFADHNLQAVFNGHYHAYTFRTFGQTVLTTDKCCSFHHANHDHTPEKGYFVCRAVGGKITRQFVRVDAPSTT